MMKKDRSREENTVLMIDSLICMRKPHQTDKLFLISYPVNSFSFWIVANANSNKTATNYSLEKWHVTPSNTVKSICDTIYYSKNYMQHHLI